MFRRFPRRNKKSISNNNWLIRKCTVKSQLCSKVKGLSSEYSQMLCDCQSHSSVNVVGRERVFLNSQVFAKIGHL